jgi:3-phenylpropionate/cinnamic acid dioxygenase small subunit
MTTATGAAVAGAPAELYQVTQFLFREARYADDSAYGEWLSLWDDDDVVYWVPSGRADYDPDDRISYINDNRNRLETRVRQLLTGHRYAQTPASPMRRVISNVELLHDPGDGAGPGSGRRNGRHGEIVVGSNFVLYEHSIQASDELRLWVGRSTHRLRRRPTGELCIGAKTVELVNATRALPNMAFLL